MVAGLLCSLHSQRYHYLRLRRSPWRDLNLRQGRLCPSRLWLDHEPNVYVVDWCISTVKVSERPLRRTLSLLSWLTTPEMLLFCPPQYVGSNVTERPFQRTLRRLSLLATPEMLLLCPLVCAVTCNRTSFSKDPQPSLLVNQSRNVTSLPPRIRSQM